EFSVISLLAGIFGEGIFPKLDHVQCNKPGFVVLRQGQRVLICRSREVREVDRTQDGFQFHKVYSATCTPPLAGSFLFNIKLKKNMTPAATERTMKVSMYARLAACACTDDT